MVLDDEVKQVFESSAFISLVTVDEAGQAHPIIAGKARVSGGTLVFGIYKMEVTQKNLRRSGTAWLVAATTEGGPRGYRLTGSAAVCGKELIFTPEKTEKLI